MGVSFDMPATISISRASVLTLWAAVVAERLGFFVDAAQMIRRGNECGYDRRTGQ